MIAKSIADVESATENDVVVIDTGTWVLDKKYRAAKEL